MLRKDEGSTFQSLGAAILKYLSITLAAKSTKDFAFRVFIPVLERIE